MLIPQSSLHNVFGMSKVPNLVDGEDVWGAQQQLEEDDADRPRVVRPGRLLAVRQRTVQRHLRTQRKGKGLYEHPRRMYVQWPVIPRSLAHQVDTSQDSELSISAQSQIHLLMYGPIDLPIYEPMVCGRTSGGAYSSVSSCCVGPKMPYSPLRTPSGSTALEKSATCTAPQNG